MMICRAALYGALLLSLVFSESVLADHVKAPIHETVKRYTVFSTSVARDWHSSPMQHSLTFVLPLVDDRSVTIEVAPNLGLFMEDDKSITEAEKRAHLTGFADGSPLNSVSLSLYPNNHVFGHVRVNDDMYVIEPLAHYSHDLDLNDDHMMVYRTSDLVAKDQGSCRFEHPEMKKLVEEMNADEPPTPHLYRRQAPSVTRTCSLQLLYDQSFLAYNGNSDSLTRSRLAQWIQAVNSQFYANPNQFGLMFQIGIEPLDNQYSIFNTGSSQSYLSQLESNSPLTSRINSNYCAVMVVSNQNTAQTLGMSYIGTICGSRNYGFSTVNDRTNTDAIVGTIAHELGHLLGSNHDGININGCADEGYIMTPLSDVSSPNSRKFSSCSQQAIRSKLSRAQCFGIYTTPQPTPTPTPTPPPPPRPTTTIQPPRTTTTRPAPTQQPAYSTIKSTPTPTPKGSYGSYPSTSSAIKFITEFVKSHLPLLKKRLEELRKEGKF